MKFLLRLCIPILMVFSGGAAADEIAATRAVALEAITEYFQLVADRQFELAGDMWAPEALERSARFGIQYGDIPLRVDCTSPAVRLLELRQTDPAVVVKDAVALDDGSWYRIEFADVIGSRLVSHNYHAQKRGDWFWLSYPQDYYAAAWPVIETDFFRIHSHPDVRPFLNPAVLAETDRFVRALADTLKLPAAALDEFKRLKIEYFYCPNGETFTQITGQTGEGIVDLAANDIISATFPHLHEIAHLMINVKLRTLPLYTLPLIREGMAVRFGGRWGKQASALLDLAVFLDKEGFVRLDSILTWGGFEAEAAADLVYPMAGLFSSYLVDRIGVEKCLQLYLDLSGSDEDLRNLTADQVGALITQAAGQKSWNDLTADFNDFMTRRLDRHLGALPGGLANGKTLLDDGRVTVTQDKEWVAFRFSFDSSVTAPAGNLLFAPESALVGQTSFLFTSQYEGQVPFEGHRYGVRFDQYEAGLYDYASNQLVAKYIWGITPSDAYYDSSGRTITVRFRKTLMNGQLPDRATYRLLPM